MTDFLLGSYFAGLAVRGWFRGLVREALDLVGLATGMVVAFRAGGPLGDYLHTQYGVSPETGRLLASGALFVAVALTAAVLARLITRLVALPGLNLANRLGGVAISLAWGLFLVLVIVSLLRALPLSEVVDRTLERSRVVALIARPEAPTQRLFQRVAGDEVLDAVLALEPLLGDRRLILEESESVRIAPALPEDLEVAVDDARLILDLINGERVSAGVDPLAWSEALSTVAATHAEEMYTEGYVGHRSPVSGTVEERMEAAGIPVLVVGENLALAASARAAHSGLMDSPTHRANLLEPRFDRAGIAAIRGPLGLMVVEVFTG